MGWDDTDTKRPKAPALRPHRWSWDYSFPEFFLTMTDRMGHGTHKMWSCGGEIEGRQVEECGFRDHVEVRNYDIEYFLSNMMGFHLGLIDEILMILRWENGWKMG